MAVEARDIVRRAAGDVAGLTVSAQVRQAARHLGLEANDWRVREAWYGRAGSWSAASLDDLRRRSAAWRQREVAHAHAEPGADRIALATRLGAVRAALIELGQEVDAIAAAVATTVDGAQQ